MKSPILHAVALFGVLSALLAAGPAPAAPLLTLGSGFTFPAGVAVDASGNVFVADTNNNQIKEMLATNGAVAPGAVPIVLGGSFPFVLPQDVALDSSGNLFVANTGAATILEITKASGYTSVIALGGATPPFISPCGIAVDASGNVFVGDQGDAQATGTAIYELTAASTYNTVTTLGGGWIQVGGVAVDASGDVFVADQGGVVWEMLAVGGAVPAVSPTITQFLDFSAFPGALQGIALDSAGNVYVADYNNNAIYEVPIAGGDTSFQTVLATGLNVPIGLAFDRFGNLYIGDAVDDAVKEIQFVSPVPVPTLGQAGLILFGLLLADTAWRAVRRRA